MTEQVRRDPLDERSVELSGLLASRLSGRRDGTALGDGEGAWRWARPRRLSWFAVGLCLCLADFATTLLAGLLSFDAFSDADIGAGRFDHVLLWATPVIGVFVFRERGFYGRREVARPSGGVLKTVLEVTPGWFHAFGLSLLVAVAWSGLMRYERDQGGASGVLAGLEGPWLLAFLVSGLGGVVATRLVWSVLRKRLVGRVLVHGRALVVGTGPEAEQVIDRLRDDPASGLEVVGILDDGTRPAPVSLRGVAVLGKLEDMAETVRRSGADTVIVALPWAPGGRVAAALAEAWRLPVQTRLAPDPTVQTYLRHPINPVAGQPLLDVHEPPISGVKAVVKRVEDLLLASLALLVLWPVLLVIAVAIKLDSRGPVFFKQPRYGFNNRVFGLYKFRSMHVHEADEACVRQTSRGDARITRVGAFLRRHSLDELPQFLNVLRGDMSVVGPRPHALATRTEGLLLADAMASYIARCRVKPGITGWAQVNGWRGQLDTREKLERRVEFDLDYAERWSVLMDLHIIWLTLKCVIRDRHAY